jgi:PRELI-like family
MSESLLTCCQTSVLILHNSHPWSHVIIGMWHKYPNSKCSHVISVDVVDRSVDPQTGIIRTERVLGCKQKTPTWIVKVRTYAFLSLCPSPHSPSSSVAQRMLLFAKYHLSTPLSGMLLSPPLTCHCPNLQHVSSEYTTPPLAFSGQPFHRRQRYRRGWRCGDPLRMV